eukprot:TRINITY_DN2506_c0_g2_i1.p1 TRINITY_DN2506_c0_g2~~TRINITY_DN2506_c0_g2_i1.p1  ORF type:complete len:257 (+),score=89.68 TRINITY_DN2506_c0_g2_i1:70-771(+)
MCIRDRYMGREVSKACKEADANDSIGAIVITGSEKAFAAGADIKEMKDKKYVEAYLTNMLGHWDNLSSTKKPIIAAVNGYALGGGCELAMMADIIIAGSNAKFGQPEITIGTIPGCGGTQRLLRALGKSRAMEIILTGEQFGAEEAAARGLVSRVVEPSKTVDEAVAVGQKISSFSRPVVAMAKECINQAEELSLSSGLRFEKKLFHSTFSLADQKEGMGAFAEKRKPQFTNL